MNPDALLTVAAGLLGLVIGSFLNVVIYRLPIMMQRDWERQAREILDDDTGPTPLAASEPEVFNLAQPRSACPACQAPVRARDNVPVISYLFLKGRCARCGVRISPRYPLVEALTGLLSAVVVWQFGLSIEAAGALVLVWSLIALSFIDLDHQLLPDIMTLPLLWLGLAASAAAGTANMPPLYPDPRSAIIGALAGYLILWSVYQAFKLLTGKEGMGHGDFKLLAALGAWLGWQMLPLIILLSAVAGSVIGIALIVMTRHERQVPIPFGPYLAIAGFVALLWGPDLLGAYLRFMQV